ncbi:MAG: ribosome small subunit-dependent GTPase A [Dehalococcoidia bacterium]|jgi:ribosome biogenesis GTPase|nr:ribosome small subunit-dependent GTPase A [Dehalococcoidia bacterium]
MHELHALGFGPYFHEQLPDEEAIPARIAGEHKQGYIVWHSAGESFARLAGRLSRGLEGEAYPGVGDWVTLKAIPEPGYTAVVDRVLTRRTVFTRGAAGAQGRQVIAANIDIVFIVTGLDANYNVRRIQRYLARVGASGARPVVILNKADACDDVGGRIAEVELAAPGATVIATSAKLERGLERVADQLRSGVTAAFVGSSGAGKSTLINALLGEEKLRTAEIRADDGRGRHTTTRREMLVFPSGGLLIDTPGMRELALPDEEGIDSVFPRIEELSLRCRFGDCTHQSEPGCAVRQAVQSGELPADGVEHYLLLRAEARANELRLDERARRRSERTIGRQRAKDMHIINRVKGR